VGEGNFSFARALVRLFAAEGENLVATAFDSEELAVGKYPDTAAAVEEVRECGGRVLFGVDARDLEGSALARLRPKGARGRKGAGKGEGGGGGRAAGGKAGHYPGGRDSFAGGVEKFDRVVFNFPHVGKGIKDEAVNVRENQELLAAFFRGCCVALRPGGEVHVAVKVGKPYSMWNILGLAHRASSGQLEQVTEYCFDPAWFPEYAHRRTVGFQEGLSKAANEEISGRSKTYVLRKKKA